MLGTSRNNPFHMENSPLFVDNDVSRISFLNIIDPTIGVDDDFPNLKPSFLRHLVRNKTLVQITFSYIMSMLSLYTI